LAIEQKKVRYLNIIKKSTCHCAKIGIMVHEVPLNDDLSLG